MSDPIKAFFDRMAPQWDVVCKHDRARLDKILTLAKVKEGDRVIDVACGTGVLTEPLLSKQVKEIYAVDLSEEMIACARMKYKIPEVRFEAMDFLKNLRTGYDQVIVHNAYPHFLDKQSLVKALHKALRPGGRFVIAHSDSREQINTCHHKLDFVLSEKLRPVGIEAEYFQALFDIDIMIDDPDIYMLSGIKKETR